MKFKRFSIISHAVAALFGMSSASKAGTKANGSDLFKRFRWIAPKSMHKSDAQDYNVIGNPNTPGFSSPFDNLYPDTGATPRGFERVSRKSQTVESAIVRGTWIQTVLNAAGGKIFETGELIENIPEVLHQKVKRMRAAQEEALETLRWSSPEFRTASQVMNPQIEIVVNSDQSYKTEWIVDFMNHSETKMLRAVLNEAGKLRGIKEIGSYLNKIEGEGNVYPRGPRMSDLQYMPLQDLDGTGHLTSAEFDVKTALTDEAVSPQFDFRFPPQDTRFDQVQVYFYADQVLKFFKTKFDAAPLAQLELKVQVGDRSNTAFYYGNRIRIGTGDGITYKNLAQDPSVVMHEVGHSIVDRYAGLPPDGEGGSLNEAFADFFAASLLNNPKMGENSFLGGPFVRTLENNYRAEIDLSGGLYRASQVISGTLWDIRQAFGPELGEKLAFKTLCRLGMGGMFKDFVPSLLAATSSDWTPMQIARIQEIVKARGWTLIPPAAIAEETVYE